MKPGDTSFAAIDLDNLSICIGKHCLVFDVVQVGDVLGDLSPAKTGPTWLKEGHQKRHFLNSIRLIVSSEPPPVRNLFLSY